MNGMWVYRGFLKQASINDGVFKIRILGPAADYWRLFQHGTKPIGN